MASTVSLGIQPGRCPTPPNFGRTARGLALKGVLGLAPITSSTNSGLGRPQPSLALNGMRGVNLREAAEHQTQTDEMTPHKVVEVPMPSFTVALDGDSGCGRTDSVSASPAGSFSMFDFMSDPTNLDDCPGTFSGAEGMRGGAQTPNEGRRPTAGR